MTWIFLGVVKGPAARPPYATDITSRVLYFDVNRDRAKRCLRSGAWRNEFSKRDLREANPGFAHAGADSRTGVCHARIQRVPTLARPEMKSCIPFALTRLANRALSILALAGAFAGCATAPSAQRIPPSNGTLPASLQATPQELLQDVLTAVGEMTYDCRSDGDHLSWAPTGSEATLVDQARHSVGTVAPGGYFLAYDGSQFVGAVAGEEIVTAGALTWQRLVARTNADTASHRGRFATVTSVQRVLTTGGLPPVATCLQEGQSLLVPYTATYLFYRTAKGTAADT